MQGWKYRFRAIQQVMGISRVLTVALMALAAGLADIAVEWRVAFLGTGYLVLSGAIWLLGPRLRGAWTIYPLILIDVGAVTALLVLAPDAPFPLWTLYLFPLVSAAVAGRVPAAVAIGLSAAGCVGTHLLATSSVEPIALWPVALLGAVTVVVAFSVDGWLADQQEWEVWQEVASTREQVRRESVLRQAAMDVVAKADRTAVLEVVARAGRDGVRSGVTIVDRATGRSVAGDEDAEAVVRRAFESQGLGAMDATPLSSGERPASRLVVPIGDDLELLAWRQAPGFDQSESAWLRNLGNIAGSALEWCDRDELIRGELLRLQSAFEAAPSPLALWDAAGGLLLANASYQALGLDGSAPAELKPGQVHDEEITVGDPPRTFAVTTVTLGASRLRLSLYREITREREALRAKDQLIALVGHELRNPLTSIQGYAQIMGRQLGVVQQQVDQLNLLISDFVDASHLESGQLSIKREPIDLVELVRAAAERFRGGHERRALNLKLPEASPIEGDRSRLAQVLDNLLANAAKYSAVETEIVLSISTGEDEVLVAVQDQGIGIAPEHLPRLFDRFYRAPGADTERVRGSGLGLSIARDLVIAHGGRIWAESAGTGHGSTFWVSLPASVQGDTAEWESVRSESV